MVISNSRMENIANVYVIVYRATICMYMYIVSRILDDVTFLQYKLVIVVVNKTINFKPYDIPQNLEEICISRLSI